MKCPHCNGTGKIPDQKGWGNPRDLGTYHYFVNGTSLCGAWGYSGYLWSIEKTPKCKECEAKLSSGNSSEK